MKPNWEKTDTGSYACKLGTLKRAIVLANTSESASIYDSGMFKNLKWRISVASHLPFTKEQYEKEFEDYEECAIYAEKIVLEWLNSLIKQVEPIEEQKKLK